MEENKMSENTSTENSVMRPEQKPNITFDEYQKIALDVRVCKIISVEDVEKADKLYKLTIDTGIDQRVVVSAIREEVGKEELLNSYLPFILNLTPRKIRGIESFGMLFACESMVSKSLIGLFPLSSFKNTEDMSDEEIDKELIGAIIL